MEVWTATTTVTINNHRRQIEALPEVEAFLDSKGDEASRQGLRISLLWFIFQSLFLRSIPNMT